MAITISPSHPLCNSHLSSPSTLTHHHRDQISVTIAGHRRRHKVRPEPHAQFHSYFHPATSRCHKQLPLSPCPPVASHPGPCHLRRPRRPRASLALALGEKGKSDVMIILWRTTNAPNFPLSYPPPPPLCVLEWWGTKEGGR